MPAAAPAAVRALTAPAGPLPSVAMRVQQQHIGIQLLKKVQPLGATSASALVKGGAAPASVGPTGSLASAAAAAAAAAAAEAAEAAAHVRVFAVAEPARDVAKSLISGALTRAFKVSSGGDGGSAASAAIPARQIFTGRAERYADTIESSLHRITAELRAKRFLALNSAATTALRARTATPAGTACLGASASTAPVIAGIAPVDSLPVDWESSLLKACSDSYRIQLRRLVHVMREPCNGALCASVIEGRTSLPDFCRAIFLRLSQLPQHIDVRAVRAQVPQSRAVGAAAAAARALPPRAAGAPSPPMLQLPAKIPAVVSSAGATPAASPVASPHQQAASSSPLTSERTSRRLAGRPAASVALPQSPGSRRRANIIMRNLRPEDVLLWRPLQGTEAFGDAPLPADAPDGLTTSERYDDDGGGGEDTCDTVGEVAVLMPPAVPASASSVPLAIAVPSDLLPLEADAGDDAWQHPLSEDDALLDSLLDGFEDIFDAPTSALTPPSSPPLGEVTNA